MKKLIITEEERKSILGMHQEYGYGPVNEQFEEQIKDPKIVNAVNTVLKRLMSSPKFATDDTLYQLIENGKYVKAYRLHRNLNTNVDYIDYELLDDMSNNPETKKNIESLLPNLQTILTDFYS